MLDPVVFDRFTMAFALAVHIVLASIGFALPAMIAICEYLGIKNDDKYYLALARRLTTAFVVMFTIGTASGMLVAVSLLFLWPPFMALVSQVAIFPVYLEVFVFFGESIFLALYVYSRDYFGTSYKHVLIMCVVAFCAALSGVMITLLNSFMNTPVGFDIPAYLQTGLLTNINPLAVFSAPAAFIEVPHVIATAYFAGASILLAYFAYRYLKSTNDKVKIYYQKAMRIAFTIALLAVLVSVYTGIESIKSLYYLQPEKFAAIELDLVPQAYAPETIFGFLVNGTIQYGIQVPQLQSILEAGNASASVPGLSQYPSSSWPPLIIHDMFDFMVIIGALIGAFYTLVFALDKLKKKVFESKVALKLFIVSGFFAVVLLENGWIVDEVGRQPWIIYNVMTVAQAANQSQSIIIIAIVIVLLYAFLVPFTLIVLNRIFSKRPLKSDLP